MLRNLCGRSGLVLFLDVFLDFGEADARELRCRQRAQDVPRHVERVADFAVVLFALLQEAFLENFTEGEERLVGLGKLVFADDGGERISFCRFSVPLL